MMLFPYSFFFIVHIHFQFQCRFHLVYKQGSAFRPQAHDAVGGGEIAWYFHSKHFEIEIYHLFDGYISIVD